MKLEPYQIYQTSPPASHQQQTGPPPPYYEAQYQRNNGLHTPSSASYGLPPTPQSANQQRCPIHGLQPCACQMVSRKFLADFYARRTRDLHKGGRRGFYMLRMFGLAMLQNQYKDRDIYFAHTRCLSQTESLTSADETAEIIKCCVMERILSKESGDLFSLRANSTGYIVGLPRNDARPVFLLRYLC